MSITWSDVAEADLDDLYDYIARDVPCDESAQITDSRQDLMSEAFQQRLPINAFVLRDRAENAVQGADTQCDVVRYGEALMPGLFGLKNNVAALLMNDTISPIAA